MDQKVISIIVAVVVFAIILIVGLLTDILKEAKSAPASLRSETPDADRVSMLGEEKSFSFRRLQLWLWSLIICPAFSLHWGYNDVINITDDCLALLGISVGTAIIGEMISASLKSQYDKSPSVNIEGTFLKSKAPTSGFWIDILKDDYGQFSIPRLQHLVFTVTFICIFIAEFFEGNKMEYVDLPTVAYALMGISAGGYLLGKSLKK